MKPIYYLSLLVLILSGCKRDYVKNKFAIYSISAYCSDSACKSIFVEFNLEYFSDSSVQKGMVLMEQGRDGSDDTIIFLGFTKSMRAIRDSNRCLSFDSFKNGYNRRESAFLGEKFIHPFLFCLEDKGLGNQKLELVLYNINRKETDTFSTILSRERKYW